MLILISPLPNVCIPCVEVKQIETNIALSIPFRLLNKAIFGRGGLEFCQKMWNYMHNLVMLITHFCQNLKYLQLKCMSWIMGYVINNFQGSKNILIEIEGTYLQNAETRYSRISYNLHKQAKFLCIVLRLNNKRSTRRFIFWLTPAFFPNPMHFLRQWSRKMCFSAFFAWISWKSHIAY